MTFYKFVSVYKDFEQIFYIKASCVEEAWVKAKQHKHFDLAKTELWK